MPGLEQEVELVGSGRQRGEEQPWHDVVVRDDVAEPASPPLSEDGIGEGLIPEQRRAEGDAEDREGREGGFEVTEQPESREGGCCCSDGVACDHYRLALLH